MRLKTFTARTIAQALQQVRLELGEDAVILSTESGRGGARLVAALPPSPDAEQVLDAALAASTGASVAAAGRGGPGAGPPPPAARLRGVLAWHGVPAGLAERLLRGAPASGGAESAAVLAAGLDAMLGFQPLAERAGGRPVMLVGPPGVGKTLTAARLIVDAHRRGRPVFAASCDTRRAGGIEQLEAFTRILDTPLARIGDAVTLADAVSAAIAGSTVIIDTAGCCPFSRDDTLMLAALIEAAEAEPVLVLAAGGDAAEAGETAASFAQLGCRRMIATRIDVSRRLGCLIAAAAGGRLALAGAAIGPHAAEPPAAVSPMSLARLLLSAAPAAAPTKL
ncbi:MAG: hypothetical protein U1E38_06825 [Rhodospirillales bacterium]